MQKLKMGLLHSRRLRPSVLPCCFCAGKVHVCTCQIREEVSVALHSRTVPIHPTVLPRGRDWGVGGPQASDGAGRGYRLCEAIAYPVRKGTAVEDLWLFHKFMRHVCFYPHFLSFSFNLISVFYGTDTRNNKMQQRALYCLLIFFLEKQMLQPVLANLLALPQQIIGAIFRVSHAKKSRDNLEGTGVLAPVAA